MRRASYIFTSQDLKKNDIQFVSSMEGEFPLPKDTDISEEIWPLVFRLRHEDMRPDAKFGTEWELDAFMDTV